MKFATKSRSTRRSISIAVTVSTVAAIGLSVLTAPAAHAEVPRLAPVTAATCLSGVLSDNGSDLFVSRKRHQVFNSCATSQRVKVGVAVYSTSGGVPVATWSACTAISAKASNVWTSAFYHTSKTGNILSGKWASC